MPPKITEESIQKKIREGYGQGEFENYKPWLTVRDVPSDKSRSSRPYSWKTKRAHQFFSDLENSYFLYLEWCDNVLDIREQFPLPRDKTTEIAKRMSIKHTLRSDIDHVMTTDFLVLLRDGTFIARTIKSSKDLEKKRNIDKFDIERVYWQNEGIDWGIINETKINKVFVKNIEYLYIYKERYFFNNDDFLKQFNYILKQLRTKDDNLINIFEKTDSDLGLNEGESLNIYKFMIANKIVEIDMFVPFSINIKASSIKINENLESNYDCG